jgi:hypothetical protein
MGKLAIISNTRGKRSVDIWEIDKCRVKNQHCG